MSASAKHWIFLFRAFLEHLSLSFPVPYLAMAFVSPLNCIIDMTADLAMVLGIF